MITELLMDCTGATDIIWRQATHLKLEGLVEGVRIVPLPVPMLSNNMYHIDACEKLE